MKAAFPRALLETAIADAQRVVAKAVDPATDILRNAAKAALASGVSGQQLEQVIHEVFAQAYAAGGHGAAQQVGGAAVSLAGVGDIDWDNWTPGSAAGAALLENGGLAALLDGSGASVAGITGTLLDQLGNQIAAGVASGDSVSTIAAMLGGIIGDPSRAETIAQTETARAMTQATMDTYVANGIGEWDWILSDGACPECEDQESANPHAVGDGDQPPLHPNCRCAAAPVMSSVVDAAGDDSGGLNVGDVASAFDEAAAGADAAVAGDEGLAAIDAAGAADGADAGLEGADDLSSVGDDELSDRLGDLFAGGAGEDDAEVVRILTELDTRDAAAKAAQDAQVTAAQDEARRAASAARSQARRDAAKAAQNDRYDELVSQGVDELSAYAEAFGQDVAKLQIKETMSVLRDAGYTGRNYEELCRSQMRDYATQAYLKAEIVTRGHMLNAEGQAAGINPRDLFTMPEARARKYASPEVLEFWQNFGRMTTKDFMNSNLGMKNVPKEFFL